MSAAAEAALRSFLQGRDPVDLEDDIHSVRSDPNRFRSRTCPKGAFARALLEEANVTLASALVPFSAPQPPAPGRQPSLVEVDVARLCEHKYFRPLGPEVYPDAPASHHFSHLLVDHTISGFQVGSEEEKAVRCLYVHLMYESKPQPPCKEIPSSYRPGEDCKRGPFFTVREHDHKPPGRGSHKEVLIYGSTQLSKTPEAAASAWCACFIDGCVPIVCVRNKGGANTGSADMAAGITKLNERIEMLFRHEVRHGNLRLPADDYRKFMLQPRRATNHEQIEFDHNLRLTRCQALIICMNPSQVKNLIGHASAAASKAGAQSGLLEILKGNTNHPYPPKCHYPYAPFDDGQNRPVARAYFILDEDDLNRSNTSSVTERLQFHAPPDVMRRLESGLPGLVQAGAAAAGSAAAGSAADPVVVDTDDEPEQLLDDDDDDLHAAADEDEEGEVNEGRMRSEFRTQMETTGVRSAVRGVVALTATPAACGHELDQGASPVVHHICSMEPPANYVGYPFTAAPYAERMIRHEPVPDRKQIVAIKKTLIYEAVLKKHHWWTTDGTDAPMPPFVRRRADQAIMVKKKDLDDIVEAGGVSSRQIWHTVDAAQRHSARRGDKVLESDGVGIALMLQSMSQRPAAQEPERRALIISNYTRDNARKLQLAHHILEGDLTLEDGSPLPDSCVCDLFVIIFDHKSLRIMWRGGTSPPAIAGSSDDVLIPEDHEDLDVLTSIRDASRALYDGCANRHEQRRRESDADCIERIASTTGSSRMTLRCFRSTYINVNHAYTALLLYAHRKRFSRPSFKLKTVCLAGDLGGRGVNFKPHGCGQDPARGTWHVQPHQGYLTDMFFMFDAVVTRQITTHGEYVLQAIGRLCTLVGDADLARMALTPPRLWTSHSCWSIITTFASGVHQWVKAMQSKRPGESITDAVRLCINRQPEAFRELWMIYFLPHTDLRWAKKLLYLRQSRCFRLDVKVGETLRATPAGVARPRSPQHGIGHNPDRDVDERVGVAVRRAEAEVARGADDDSDSADEDDSMAAPVRHSRRLNRRLNPTVAEDADAMQLKFELLYRRHPEFATAADGRPMPKYNDLIWKQWDDTGDGLYYPALVVDIQWDDRRQVGVRHPQEGADGVLLYEIQFETNDDFTPISDGETRHAEEVTLDQSMDDWSFVCPNAPGPWRQAFGPYLREAAARRNINIHGMTD